MTILYNILIVLEAIVCLLLIGIVLLQKSTGDGNGLSFGGGAESVFGAQTGNVLTRSTVVLAVIFLLNTLALCVVRPTATGGESRSAKIEKAQRDAAAAAATATDVTDALLDDEDVTAVPTPVAEPSAVEPNAPAAEPSAEPAADAPAAEPVAPATPAADAPAAEQAAPEAPAAEAPAAEPAA